MGIVLLASLFSSNPWLYREVRFHPNIAKFGRFAPPVAGAAFGFGWTPCIGPVLGSILAIAASTGRAWAGGTLLAAYALGLGLPFLATGLAFDRMTNGFAMLRRFMPAFVVISGLTMVGLGGLLIANQLPAVTNLLQDILGAIGLDFLINLG